MSDFFWPHNCSTPSFLVFHYLLSLLKFMSIESVMLFNHLILCNIKPVNPKGNQQWIFIGRTEAEAPVLWLPDVKNWLICKDPDAGKDRRQEDKGTTEDEMVGWHHQFNDMNLGKLREMVRDREDWCAAAHGITKSWTLLDDWTTTM